MGTGGVRVGMSYANWQCRLYGHRWRHPGEYEVVVTGDAAPAYPFRCESCDARMFVDGNGDRFRDEPDRAPGKSETDLESAADPEPDLESAADPKPDLESAADPEPDAERRAG